jgi:hypothetical protein
MPTPEKGSEAWFEAVRRRSVDHLRAYESVRMADSYMAELLGHQDPSPVLRSALHSAAVTAYAQAFTEARTGDGTVQYKTRALRKAVGFDKQLHDHLMELRNELIAHADYAKLPPAMDMRRIGDLDVELTVKVKRLVGVRSRPLVERYRRHFQACIVTIEALLVEQLRELVAEARRRPAAFNATHNVPEVAVSLNKTGQFEDLPPGVQVPEPTFSGDLDGYDYVSVEHRLPLVPSGKHVVRGADGNEMEIDIEVSDNR